MYCWVPSHVGIYGNEQVDKKAKESLSLEQTDFKIPFINFKPFINEYVFNEWQSIWSRADDNKLKEIKPHVKRPRLIHKLSRREEIVLSRLRIGHTRLTHSYLLKHTRLTHSYLLKREDKPQCIGFDTQLNVKHFLLECIDFIDVRRSCFQSNSLKDLFKNVCVERILSFLKRTNLFNKI